MLRKLVAALALLGLCVAAFAGWLWWRVGEIETHSLTPDVWMLSGLGGNVGVLRTRAGAIVVDTMTFPRQGVEIVKRVEELTEQPVAVILNTHYHRDHTHGNPAFAPGTRVVSTARTLAHLRERDAAFWRDAPVSELLPNETFDDGSHEIALGGKTVRSYHTGPGHTDGDLVVHFVEDRVLHTGDLFFNGRYPNIDLEAGGTVREWPATLQRVLDLGLDVDVIVPGHGAPSDRAGLVRFQEFLRSLWTQTSGVAARGGSLDDALREVDLAPFDLHRIWYAPSLTSDFVIRRAYEEAMRDPPAARPASP